MLNVKKSPVVSKADINHRAFCSFSVKQLTTLKSKAMRLGVWFKALNRLDRVLLDLTIRVVGNIRSAKLSKSILMVTRKLKEAMESHSVRLRRIGLPIAQEMSAIAQKLGNAYAKNWAFDSSFATFLAIIYTYRFDNCR